MRKYIFRKGLVLGIITLFIGVSVIPIISGDDIDSSISSNNYKYIKKVGTKGDRDQIDQSQIDIDNTGQIFRNNIWGAQCIKPTYIIQTRVFLAICKTGNPPNDVTISIRDSLSGADLTTTYIPKDQIPSYPGILWLEANYQDIIVTPQQSYYIVARTTGGDDSNYYLWFGSNGNPYPVGEPWYSEDYGYWWGIIYDMDLCFETYGRDNLFPEAPIISGPNSGLPGISYDFTFNAVDPDGDDVRFIIEWGDLTSDLTEFVTSGTDVTLSHIWTSKGSYTITVKAMDTYGMVGPESTKTIIIPRNKASGNLLFFQLFERFQNTFPIIQNIFRL